MSDNGNDQLKRRNTLLLSARRIVVKIGSGVLTGGGFTDVDDNVVASIAKQVATLIKNGRKVCIVSSGSVMIGAKKLSLARHGLSIPEKQASAALGQTDLISIWARHFAKLGLKVGQILLTHDDLSNRRRYLNARNTINTLLDYNVVPVINENDTVAVHEIKFGDNDTLSARVTNLLEAELLAILSDVDGLYTADPRLDKSAKKIEFIEEVNEEILKVAGDSSSLTGLGGMASKVRAAAEAAKFGAATIILPGGVDGSLLTAIDGERTGAFFFPHTDRLTSKKHWIAFHLKTKGNVVVDDGARAALMEKGKSLLCSGVLGVEGVFEAGEAVNIVGEDMVEFAKGIVKYHSSELEKIKGRKSDEIEGILGYKPSDEAIHRDDMAFIKGASEVIEYEKEISAEIKGKLREIK